MLDADGISFWHVILFCWDCLQMGDIGYTFNKPKQAELDYVPDIPESTDYCGR